MSIVRDNVRSLEAMPKFKFTYIQHACKTMHVFLGKENPDNPLLAAGKQQELADRTVSLLAALRRADKLEGTVTALECESPEWQEQ